MIKNKLLHAKSSLLALGLAAVHFIISIPLSNLIFIDPGDDELLKRNKLLVNIIFFIALFLSYQGIIFLVKNRHKYRKYIKFGLLYFLLLMFILFLIWPGGWRGPNDECVIALYAKQYTFYGWHHFLTSLLYMLSFKLIPIFSSVIIVQCAIISIITSYLYNELVKLLKLKHLLSKFLLAIPFFLPPVIDCAFYPLRAIIFGYVVVLAIFFMCKSIITKTITIPELCFSVIAFVLASTWRSEGIYFVVVAVVFFLYLFCNKIIPFKPTCLAIFFSILAVFTINSLQNSTLSSQMQKNYKIVSIHTIVTPIISEIGSSNQDTELINQIGKVIYLEQNEDNSKTIQENYTDEDYNNFLKASLKLILKYPKLTLKNRLSMFLHTIVSSQSIDSPINVITFFEEPSSQTEILPVYQEFYNHTREFRDAGGTIMLPWNTTLRSTILKLLEGRDQNDYYAQTLFSAITWNLIVPMLATFIFFVALLIKKRPAFAFAIGSIFIKTAIVFLTAPLWVHMYYYTEYLLGYIILFSLLAYATRNLHRSTRQK